jgi:anti-anti-sigma factor
MSTSVIEISGSKIDVFNLNKQLEGLYLTKNIKTICMDVRNCDYMNSYTLGTIIYYYSLMMKQDRKIIFMLSENRENYMNRMFETTGLEKLFEIVKNLDEIKE